MFRSLFRLGQFVGKYKIQIVIGIVAFFVARIFEAMIPLFMREGIDLIAEGTTQGIWVPVVGIAIAVILRYVVVTFARILVRRVAFYVSYDLRQRLFDQLQLQGARFFSQYTVGDMMTRAVADIQLIQRVIAMGTIMLVVMVFATVVGLSFMLYLSPSLTLLILPPLPFIFLYAWQASKQMGVTSRLVQERLSNFATHVQENLSGIRTIQAMVQEDNEIKRFSNTNQQYADAFYEQGRIQSLMGAWMPTLAATCSLIILGYGGSLVLAGTISVGTFAAFFMYVNMIVMPFRMAGQILIMFQRAAVASDRLFEVFDLPPEIEDRPSSTVPKVIEGTVELRGLTYRYEGARDPALCDVDLTIEPGQSVTIMGRVGAGKSTLLKLLVRLIDPAPGTVLIDGHDIRDYPLAQLRSQVVLVPQDPFLFAEPLGTNITYDDPERALDLVWSAAEAADLRSTVESFPKQLDTLIGERGVTLSGGQKQRATLARGLIRHSPVLILDDCFSSVDTETEEHILTHLKRLRGQLTTILVSHRVSTARHSDRIVVLDDGRIIEQGAHAELIAAGGFYAELERVQREGAEDAGDLEYLGASA
jgi:ATP-binding cassette, subfamily B, multidrug efflux pump